MILSQWRDKNESERDERAAQEQPKSIKLEKNRMSVDLDSSLIIRNYSCENEETVFRKKASSQPVAADQPAGASASESILKTSSASSILPSLSRE